MRNFVFLVLFLALVSGLIWWLWSDGGDEKTLEQAVAEQQAQQNVPEKKGVPRIDLDEVEIAYDDEGLIIKTLFNQEVNLVITTNPARNVEVYDGIMTYQELVEGNWNFRSYNLGQYIQENLKDS